MVLHAGSSFVHICTKCVGLLRIQIWFLDIHRMMVYEFSVCCYNKLPQTWWLDTTGILFYSSVSQGSSTAITWCWQGVFFSADSREGSISLPFRGCPHSWVYDPPLSLILATAGWVLTLHHSHLASVVTSPLNFLSLFSTFNHLWLH